MQNFEMAACLEHNLIPTVTEETAIYGMAQAIQKSMANTEKHNSHTGNSHVAAEDGKTSNGTQCESRLPGTVHIKLDSGMSRNGCQPEELHNLIKVRPYQDKNQKTLKSGWINANQFRLILINKDLCGSMRIMRSPKICIDLY